MKRKSASVDLLQTFLPEVSESGKFSEWERVVDDGSLLLKMDSQWSNILPTPDQPLPDYKAASTIVPLKIIRSNHASPTFHLITQ